MTQPSALLHFPPAQDRRTTEGDALRSEQPLLPPVSRPDLQAPSARDSARLGAALTLKSRWPVLAVLALLSTLLLPRMLVLGPSLEGAGHGLLALLAMIWGGVRGVDGRSRDRAFWMGLGVRPRAFELGVVGVDLGVLAGIAGVAFLLTPATEHLLVAVLQSVAFFLYGFGSATRAAAPSEGGRLAAMAVMGLGVAATAWVGVLLGLGSVPEGLACQLFGVSLLGIASRVLLAARQPESAVGRGRFRWSWLACTAAGIAVLPLQRVQQVTQAELHPDAPSLRVPELNPLASKQVWRSIGPADAWERVALTGFLHNPTEHDSGAVLYRRIAQPELLGVWLREDAAVWGVLSSGRAETPAVVDLSRPGLLTPDGEVVECDLGVPSQGATWDDNGLGLTLPGGWRLDASGCRQTGGGQP